MTSTEIETYQPPATALGVQMDYARAVASGSLLPDQYRNNPANVLIAVGLGQSMGLSPAESLYRITVIQGKPTASAELIAANVRKAGHRLRITGDETSATATIIRADDPDYEFTVTRDLAWAKSMKLTEKDNYRKQPGTMLQWRAITAVARLACPEALYGVAYSSDEMYDSPPTHTASSGLAAALQTSDPEPTPDDSLPPVESSGSEPVLLNTRSKLAKAMYAAISEAGISEAERLPWISGVIGHDIGSSKEMTEAEARQVLDHLADVTQQPFEADVVEAGEPSE